jgi:fatty acid desaturase
MDPDGFAAEPLVLFNDYQVGSPRRTWAHSFQALYIVPILSGYWLSAVFNLAEVWDLQDRGAREVGIKMDNAWIASRAKFAFSLRILHLLTNIVAPLYVNGLNWTTVAHINVMGAAGSLSLGLLFVLSHNFENADRDPTKEVRKTGEPVCWFRAQVETSSTYGGMISGWISGGLNFQVEHHLFPRKYNTTQRISY